MGTKERRLSYSIAFLALLGAPYIYDISSLRVNNTSCDEWMCAKLINVVIQGLVRQAVLEKC